MENYRDIINSLSQKSLTELTDLEEEVVRNGEPTLGIRKELMDAIRKEISAKKLAQLTHETGYIAGDDTHIAHHPV